MNLLKRVISAILNDILQKIIASVQREKLIFKQFASYNNAAEKLC